MSYCKSHREQRDKQTTKSNGKIYQTTRLYPISNNA